MFSTPYVASLRVYEPFESFDESDRLLWSDLGTNLQTARDEQISAIKRLIYSQRPNIGLDGAHIIDYAGARYVAPWSTGQRCWVALNEFKNSLPSSVIPLFFANSEFQDELNSNFEQSAKVPHILTETWMIPPRWFALFSPEERLRGFNVDGAFTILRAKMVLAKQRCLAAHEAVRKAFGPGPVEEELVQLMNWLNIFDPRSIVECDYGGLANYLDKSLNEAGESGLEADTSIEDVHTSIEGLKNGDGALAGLGYERLVTRWRRVAAFEQAM